MKTTLNVKVWMMAFAAVAMTACVKDSVDMTQTEQLAKATYAENFAKKYPNVSLNQSWDLTSKSFDFSLPVSGNGSRRASAVDYNFTRGDWYEVDNNTLSWMHEQLVEGQDNRSLGNPFYMSVPGNEFTIVPIYQGVAGARWDLHVVVDGVDIKVWEKQYNGTEDFNIQIKDGDSNEWHNLHGQQFDGWFGSWPSLFNTDGGDKWTSTGSPNLVTDVRAIPYTFSNLPVGKDMYFYLEITEAANDENNNVWRNRLGTKQSSIKGMMLALDDCPVPANIDPSYEAMIIGCEDADLKDSDWDMNDVVFLVYGKTVPKPVVIETGTPVVQSRTVRYMIEDLGATDDFDFNDVVVDVTESRVTTPTITNGVITSWEETAFTQKAVIRHLGGTLPFVLTIGNTELSEHKGLLDVDVEESFDVTGWNPDTHNVSVKVRQSASSSVYNEVKFPKAGEAPMIIAVNPTQNWMPERVSVPESWFYTPEDEHQQE
mgnify:CR=1 FL=1